MANKILIKRGTRAQLDAAKTAAQLNIGELYYITDVGEKRIAVGTANNDYQDFSKVGEGGNVNAGTLDVSVSGTAATSGNALAWGTATGFTANSTGATTYDLRVGPSLSALATLMDTGGAGFIRRGATANTYTIDTSSYTTTSTSISAFAAAAADISLGNFKITNLANPSAASDAATKAYVDGAVQGIDTKASVIAATAATLGTVAYNNGSSGVGATLTNTGTLAALVVDGISTSVNDRILVKNQATASQNGIYTVTAVGSGSVAWVLTRATDNDTWAEVPQAYVFVEQGTQENNGYLFTADQGGTMGSTAITITQFSGAGQITDGAGLLKTGNTLDVRVAANRTVINGSDEVDIASTYVGQSSITTLGTVTTGTWSATAIAATSGGTGQTTYATGDILYASASNTLTKLTKPATLDSFLQMTAAGVPTWESTIDGGTF